MLKNLNQYFFVIKTDIHNISSQPEKSILINHHNGRQKSCQILCRQVIVCNNFTRFAFRIESW